MNEWMDYWVHKKVALSTWFLHKKVKKKKTLSDWTKSLCRSPANNSFYNIINMNLTLYNNTNKNTNNIGNREWRTITCKQKNNKVYFLENERLETRLPDNTGLEFRDNVRYLELYLEGGLTLLVTRQPKQCSKCSPT